MREAEVVVGNPRWNTGMLQFTLEVAGDSKLVWFRLPIDWEYNPDLIAVAASTLTGSAFARIHFDFEVSESVLDALEKTWKVQVTASRTWVRHKQLRTGFLGLNFSGGFDSLAAWAIAPSKTRLVSIDFGKGFEREPNFFQSFPTTTVRTNLREIGLAKNSWTFMGVGTVLLRDYLGLYSVGFGSILEASTFGLKAGLSASETGDARIKLSNRLAKGRNIETSGVFGAAGLSIINPVAGLTEIGTAKIVNLAFPKLARESLESLADPGSEKKDRKRLLITHFRGAYPIDEGGSHSVESLIERPSPQFSYGQYLVSDFLAFWILKRFGIRVAERVVADIPADVRDFTVSASLDFYEKLNSAPLYSYAPGVRNSIVRKSVRLGLEGVSEQDMKEYRGVLHLLAERHEGLRVALA